MKGLDVKGQRLKVRAEMEVDGERRGNRCGSKVFGSRNNPMITAKVKLLFTPSVPSPAR